MPLPIEDYAAIGDGHTAALIGINGSLDWLCLPQFDSPACFAGLLGDDDNGHWLIGPVGEHTAERRYVGDTAVLETTYRTETGEIRVTDLMPTGERRADVVRRVEGVRGTVSIEHRWVVRYDYGRIRPWVHREDVAGHPAIIAVAGPDKLVLTGPRLPTAHDGTHEETFDVHEGDRLDFTLTWVPSYRGMPDAGGGRRAAGPHPRGAAGLGRRLPVRRPVAPRGRPQPGDPPRAHPRGHRRHRRGADHLPARGLRRRAQLGLPLLLAARRRPHPGVAARGRARRQRAPLARLAAARHRR